MSAHTDLKEPKNQKVTTPQSLAQILSQLSDNIEHKRLADVFRFISFTPHETYGPHQHLRIEINYVYRGNCFLEVGGRRLKFRHGEMMIIPSLVPHFFESGSRGCTLMQLEFLPSLISSLTSFLPAAFSEDTSDTVIRIIDNTSLTQTIRQIISELTAKRPLHEQLVMLHYAELQLHLCRYLEENFLPQDYPDALKQAVNNVRSNYAQPLSVRTMAPQSGVSERYLRRLFTLYLHTNPNDFLNRTRISKAAELIRQTTLSIKEICFQCGFRSQAHFSRMFKRYEGCLPHELNK